MRILLIRHAVTAGNTHYYVGREDLPLTDEGRGQVCALVKAIEAERIDVVFSSPLARALETATPLAGPRGVDVNVRPGLVEIDYGELQGTDKRQTRIPIRKQYRETPMPGGESLRDVWARLGPVGDELLSGLTARRVTAVVSHFWSSRLLLARLRGLAFEQAFDDRSFKPANASAYAIDFGASPGGIRVEASGYLFDGGRGAGDD